METEIKELIQSKPGTETESNLPNFEGIRQETRSSGIALEAKPALGDAI